jgi:hypothetical protein
MIEGADNIVAVLTVGESIEDVDFASRISVGATDLERDMLPTNEGCTASKIRRISGLT